MSGAPSNEDYLRTMMPGLSDVQIELRAKLRVARDFANGRIGSGELPYHAWQLCALVGDGVNAMVFKPMPDEQLTQAVEYCRLLVRAAIEAEELFREG